MHDDHPDNGNAGIGELARDGVQPRNLGPTSRNDQEGLRSQSAQICPRSSWPHRPDAESLLA
jgi:hypothetical protein